MFLGEYQHSLDEKGRVVVPRKFRDALVDGCVITKGQDHCLFVFPMDRWNEEAARVSALPRTNKQARAYARAFFAAASDQTLDKQGRIAVPEGLRGYAALDKDVTIVGVAERIEIWSPQKWDEIEAAADEDFAGIEESLSEERGI